jgi:hypothetical protein
MTERKLKGSSDEDESTNISYLYKKEAERASLDDVRFRPFSFLIGVGMGYTAGKFNPSGQGLEKIADEAFPYVASAGIGFYFLPKIIYLDNKLSGLSEDNAKYNSRLCIGNYSLGFGIGFSLSKLF